MHATFVLAGLATMLLGPILPLLATRWHLRDSQSGLLVLAQFCGATLGGSTTSHHLRRGLSAGLLCATLGFFAFALSPGLALACASLLLAGFGVGRIVATVNIIAGERYTRHRASSLSWLNFSWSFGALLSPLSAASLASRLPLPPLLAALALCFLVAAAVLFVQLRRVHSSPAAPSHEPPGTALPTTLFLYFAALLLVYGGFETCLSVWLTTYALRYGQSSLVLSEYTMVLFLCGLTSGRALAAWLLLKMRDSVLLRLALLVAALFTAALAMAHTAVLIASLAVLLGIALAPVFPATFAIVMARRPPARQAGIILAASGIGAATLPWLMGVVSTHTGSLQRALTLPVAAALLLFLLTLLPALRPPARAAISSASASV